MIKPDFWSDEKLNSVSLESNLLFISLWNFCDDYGTMFNSNRRILGDVFPYRKDVSEEKVDKWKNELIEIGLLIRVSYENKEYLVIKNWEKHQTVPNRSKLKFLKIGNIFEIVETYNDNCGLNRDYLDTNEGLIRVYFSKVESRKKKVESRKRKISKDEAEKIYLEYPLKKGKVKGVEKLQKVDADLIDKIVTKIKQYKQCEDPKYYAHFSTWVNQERWEDDYAKSNNKSSRLDAEPDEKALF